MWFVSHFGSMRLTKKSDSAAHWTGISWRYLKTSSWRSVTAMQLFPHLITLGLETSWSVPTVCIDLIWMILADIILLSEPLGIRTEQSLFHSCTNNQAQKLFCKSYLYLAPVSFPWSFVPLHPSILQTRLSLTSSPNAWRFPHLLHVLWVVLAPESNKSVKYVTNVIITIIFVCEFQIIHRIQWIKFEPCLWTRLKGPKMNT